MEIIWDSILASDRSITIETVGEGPKESGNSITDPYDAHTATISSLRVVACIMATQRAHQYSLGSTQAHFCVPSAPC